jgi:SAM-dependent methyltransferase
MLTIGFKRANTTLPAIHELPGLEPISRHYGKDRGTPIDRWYIHHFLWPRREDVRGRVLEVADSGYTDYLGEDRVTTCDVLHVAPDAPLATIIGDLATGEGIPRAAFDCFVVTQTLHVIYDVACAVRTIHDSLKPGGVVLATLPGISQISRYDREQWGDYWRFTAQSAARLFGDVFGAANVEVVTYGNVLVASAFLYGYAAEDLREDDLLHRDDDFDFLIGVRARRPE